MDSYFYRCSTFTLDLTAVDLSNLSTKNSGGNPGGSFSDRTSTTPPPFLGSPSHSRGSSLRWTGGYEFLTLTVLGSDGPFFCISNVKLIAQPNNS